MSSVENGWIGTELLDRFHQGWRKPTLAAITAMSIGYVFFTAAMNPDFVAARLYNLSSIITVLIVLCANGFSALVFNRSPRPCFMIAVAAMAILALILNDRAAAVTPLYWYSLLLLSITTTGAATWIPLMVGASIDTLVGTWVRIPRSQGVDNIANATLGPTTPSLLPSAVNVAISYTVILCIGKLLLHHQRRNRDHSVQISRLHQERDREVEQAVTAERTRMARELHDVSAHHLTAVIIQAKAAREVLTSHPHEVSRLLNGVIDQGDQALNSMRQLVDVLRIERSSTSSPQPLIRDLEELVDGCRDAGLSIDFRVLGSVNQLDTAVQLSCYRIVQECLSNVMRHASNAETRVTVQEAKDVLTIEVLNRLTGTTPQKQGRAGSGLIGMRERAELFGGLLTVETTDSGWWKVLAKLPTEGVISR